LRRRFFGLACPEAKSRKTRLLVLDGLLRAEENYEAAYRVIEAELAFAHDHFFTSCGSFNTKLGNITILLSIAKFVIYPITILSSIKDFIHNKNKSSSNLTGTVIGGGFDPVVTALVVMVVLMALEVLQLYLYLSSDWAKVKLARRSIYFFSKQIRQRLSIWSIFGADTCFGMFGLFICFGMFGLFIFICHLYLYLYLFWDMLSRDTTLHAKYARMKYYREQPSDRERTLIKGIRLGRKLQVMGDGMRWKVLADFWTEMILFVAPSHNAKAHIERLASGGEFLTHLWALLFHAGILERNKKG
jgi:hypothetical protein